MQKINITALLPLSLVMSAGIILGIFSCYFLYESNNITIISSLALYGMACAGLFFAFLQSEYVKLYVYFTVAIVVGFVRFYGQLYSFSSFDYTPFKKPTTIIAQVTNCATSPTSRLNQCFHCDIKAIKDEKATRDFYATKNSIMLYSKSVMDLQVGDTVELRNITLKFIENKKFATYLMKEGFVSTLFIEKLDYQIIDRPTYSWARWVHTYKTNLFESIKKKCSMPTFTYFASLFLGERSTNKKFLDHASEQFKFWGISHYLARSGLHMVIFVLLWQFLLRLLPLGYMIKEISLFALGIIYYLFSWSSISFIRAFLIFSFYKWCNIANRLSHFLHILAITTSLALLYNPLYLFFLDFQLSFLLTFALAWIAAQGTTRETVTS